MNSRARTAPLPATIAPVREAARRGLGMRATMRATPETPRDADILDISASGFLAEMPDGIAIEPGTTVRVAAASLGGHMAVAVRREGRRHGFAFLRPLSPDMLDGLDPGMGTVVPLGRGDIAAALDLPRRSARSSLAIMTGVSLALWTLLGSVLFATAHLV